MKVDWRTGGSESARRCKRYRFVRMAEACHKPHPFAFSAFASVFMWLAIFPGLVNAQCPSPGAKAVSVQGKVEVKRAGVLDWKLLARGEALCAGDSVRTDSHSRAGIQYGDHTLMRLDQRTTLTFPAAPVERTWIDVLRGALHFISRTPQRLEVDTPFMNAAIEGTEFALRVENARSLLWVYEGRVIAENAQGTLTLTNSEAAVAAKGKAPRPAVALDPRDAVEWALYYPPLLDLRKLDTGPSQTVLSQAVALYRRGNVSAALRTLDQVPDAERDARYFNIKTGLLLSVGRVKKAQLAIAAARQRNPQSGAPLAHESIIALTQNRKALAQELAGQAVAQEPQSPVVHAARSYALQAAFDLEGALTSARRAVNLAPGDALAWARLGELELSRGFSDAAINAAEKAKALDPAVARIQTVLGFVNLTRADTRKAIKAFSTAINHDQADPLPRLGLGLAKIREGNLEEGRRDTEIAASLDPSKSIVRSYLGKAYFEETRDPLAAEQYAIAKELDPKDPTPWFYNAILEQTENRPVEALYDIQRSIKRNNNRAVYRSRLLLDQDLAARSASQARIYQDLGFEQLALVEGWKSVNTDPTSYSAHRFLADSYSSLPRHEIARVSELLQSQLLQPLNVTPIQPQLSVSNPLILEGLGPTGASFTEFNPLFLHNGLRFVVDGVVGSNDTWGEDVVVAGIHNWLSYSLGQFHFESDGFRENSDQESDIYDAFVQASLSSNTSVQAEIRSLDSESGDLSRSLNASSFSPNRRFEEETDTWRLGLHHAFAPGKDLLLSVINTSTDGFFVDSFPPEIGGDMFSVKTGEEGYVGEVQQHLNYSSLGLIGGAGYLSADLLPQSDSQTPSDNLGTHDLNGYLYSYLDLPANIALNLGLSVDDFSDNAIGTEQEEQQVNPKFGLIWTPIPSTTLRAAAFRVLKRTLIATQTLEPTQVAGFNQFFDDINGTDSTRWGLALDHQFSDRLYGGLEYSQRALDVPILTLIRNDPLISKYDWNENLARAYFFYAPQPRWAFRVESSYEFFDRGDDLVGVGPEGFGTLRTLRTPLGVSYFHPSGLSFSLDATYFDQEGLLFRNLFNPESVLEEADEKFWVMDAQLSYRLPQRKGIVALELSNFLDENSFFQETNLLGTITPGIAGRPVYTFSPERTVLLRISLSF